LINLRKFGWGTLTRSFWAGSLRKPIVPSEAEPTKSPPGMVELGNLEIHAWHGCNLSCESCSHYSPLGIQGGPTAAQCAQWIDAWSDRLHPTVFSILGGEPTLNRDLAKIVEHALAAFPNSRIRLSTNGFLLNKHIELPEVMMRAADRVILEISAHHGSAQFEKKFAKVRSLADRWRREYGLHVEIKDSYNRWTRRYHVRSGEIIFLDGNPRAAWNACIGKHCKQLFLGKIWKCPPITYFNLMQGSLAVGDSWRRLAASYRPLEPSCSDEELTSFFLLEEENVCRLCPNTLERFDLPNPMSRGGTVTDPTGQLSQP
jgi:Radical SAM superfamily/4Fe-4S single cluster domain